MSFGPVAQESANGNVVDFSGMEQLQRLRLAEAFQQPPSDRVEEARSISRHVVMLDTEAPADTFNGFVDVSGRDRHLVCREPDTAPLPGSERRRRALTFHFLDTQEMRAMGGGSGSSRPIVLST